MRIHVTTAHIAAALGFSREAVLKRAKKLHWPTTGARVQGGGDVYDLETITVSAKERNKIRKHVIAVLQRNSHIEDKLEELAAQKTALDLEYRHKLDTIKKQIRKIKKQLGKAIAAPLKELQP